MDKKPDFWKIGPFPPLSFNRCTCTYVKLNHNTNTMKTIIDKQKESFGRMAKLIEMFQEYEGKAMVWDLEKEMQYYITELASPDSQSQFAASILQTLNLHSEQASTEIHVHVHLAREK